MILVDQKRYAEEAGLPRFKQRTSAIWDDSKAMNALLDADRDSARLKKATRDGIPDHMRALVWPKLLRVERLQGFERNYERALKTYDIIHPMTGRPVKEAYPSFGGAMIDSNDYALTDTGIEVAKNILRIIGKACPQIEFCPMLSTLVPLLLHHLTPDDTLGAIKVMVRHTVDRKKWFFFPITSPDMLVLYNAFSEVASRHTRVLNHLKQMETGSSFCAKWINTFLFGMMTLPVAFRLLDSFLVEGYKILIRYGIGALVIKETDILQCTKGEYIDAMFKIHPIGRSMEELEAVAKAAHGFSFSRAEVERLRQKSKEIPSIMTSDFRMSDDELVSPFKTAGSLFLKESHWEAVWKFIPRKLTWMEVQLIYSTEKHGYRLNTLYSRIGDEFPLLMFIETADGAIIGAFLADLLSNSVPSERFFGTAETFVFQLTPKPEKFSWVGIKNQQKSATVADESLFILGNTKLMAIGGGGTFFGISFDEDMKRGTTGRSKTFDNPPLGYPNSTNQNVSFEIRHIEVWAFK